MSKFNTFGRYIKIAQNGTGLGILLAAGAIGVAATSTVKGITIAAKAGKKAYDETVEGYKNQK